jgi:hypothetical protein
MNEQTMERPETGVRMKWHKFLLFSPRIQKTESNHTEITARQIAEIENQVYALCQMKKFPHRTEPIRIP